jgi:excisionase family DNA binding protein
MLSVKQAAEVLGLSAETVYRRIADGSIPSSRIGRSVRVPVRFVESLTRLPGELPGRALIATVALDSLFVRRAQSAQIEVGND